LDSIIIITFWTFIPKNYGSLFLFCIIIIS
jgi:hypothetical protein